MTTPKLTQAEYVAFSGIRCPACGHDDVIGHSIEITGGGAEQEISCDACPATWIDTYKLTGYADLEMSE